MIDRLFFRRPQNNPAHAQNHLRSLNECSYKMIMGITNSDNHVSRRSLLTALWARVTHQAPGANSKRTLTVPTLLRAVIPSQRVFERSAHHE